LLQSAAIDIGGREQKQGHASSPESEGSRSYGGTKAVFEILRGKMGFTNGNTKDTTDDQPEYHSCLTSSSSSYTSRSSSAERLNRSRSNSSGQLPHGRSSPPARRRQSTDLESKMGRPRVIVNRKVLKQLLVPNQPASYYNDLMRLHFQRLTAFFLLPLEQYFASLIPPANTISPFKPPPRIAAFSEENFLKSLCRDDRRHMTGTALSDQQLYKRFLRSQNYHGWLHKRQSETNAQLERCYARAFLSSKIPPRLRTKPEIEIVDFYLLFQDNVKVMRESANAARVESCSEAILACLPQELACSILSQQKARAAHESGVEEDGSGGESGDYSDY